MKEPISSMASGWQHRAGAFGDEQVAGVLCSEETHGYAALQEG